MANRVWAKGEVVIKKSIRDALGVKLGWLTIQQLVEGCVEIYFIPPEHNDSLYGVLVPFTDVRIPDADAFHDATEQAWAEHAAELVKRMRDTFSE